MAHTRATKAARVGATALFGTLGVALVASTIARLPAREPTTASRPHAPPPTAKPAAVNVAARAALPEPSARPASPPAPVSTSGTTQAPIDPDTYIVKRVLDVPKPFVHGDFYWDEQGVPAGPVIITVDLVAQTLSVFRNGYEIGTAVVLYGADRKPTPTGTFTITQKDADHISNLYDAPMPYMMRLTNDGVAIHGSPELHPSYATHGCVGLPIPFARKLFAATKLGTRVIITRGRMIQRNGRKIAA